MTPTEALELFRELGACEPALVWLAHRVSVSPEITLLELHKEVLKIRHLDPDPKFKPPEGTHTGKSWLAWICRHVAKIPCNNGTFSGMVKVYDGPAVENIDPNTIISGLVKAQERAKVNLTGDK